MAQPNLIAELTGIVRAIGRIGPDVTIDPEAQLDEDLGLDSLAVVEVILKVEDTYLVTIDEDDAATLKCVRSLAEYVGARRGSAAA